MQSAARNIVSRIPYFRRTVVIDFIKNEDRGGKKNDRIGRHRRANNSEQRSTKGFDHDRSAMQMSLFAFLL